MLLGLGLVLACNTQKSMVGFTEQTSVFGNFDSSDHLQAKVPTDEFYLLDGYDLYWRLLEPIDIANTNEKIYALSKRLSPAQKALYCWWFVDGQVTNGGFVQFYYNGYGKYMLTAIEGIRYIGDQEMADLMAQAYAIYLSQKAIIEKERAAGRFNGELYDKLDDLSSLDDQYYKINEQTVANIAAYAHKNPSDFCLDEEGKTFQQLEGQKIVKFEDGTTKAILNFTAAQIDGPLELFYANGQPKAKLVYEMGTKSGVQAYFREADGSLKRRDHINRAENHILRETFYTSGSIKERSNLDSLGESKGFVQEWYENGNLKEEATFISNISREGKWIKYWPDGSLRMEAIAIGDDMRYTGYWTEEGKRLLTDGTGTYINEYISSFSNDTTIYISEYKDYLRDGVSITMRSGVMTLYQEFKAGKEHGWTRTYTNTGELKRELYYENGIEKAAPKNK